MNEIHSSIDEKVYFCNNCGSCGHTFNKCNEPITSLGVIAFTMKHGVYHYLMIQRKDSLGFVDFIRGKYNIKNLQYLLNIFNEMTVQEKTMLKLCTFQQLWDHMWNYREISVRYKNELEHSKKKFTALKNGVEINGEMYTIDKLVSLSTTEWNETEWGFPKGRRNYKETDLNTALREFNEETGLNIKDLHILKNVIPYDEVFTGSNYKSYRSRYYIAGMMENTDQFQKQDCEVNDIGWFTFEECMKKIRNNHQEKQQILIKINQLLSIYGSN